MMKLTDGERDERPTAQAPIGGCKGIGSSAWFRVKLDVAAKKRRRVGERHGKAGKARRGRTCQREALPGRQGAVSQGAAFSSRMAE
jgi:hypothetical protein